MTGPEWLVFIVVDIATSVAVTAGITAWRVRRASKSRIRRDG